MDALERDFYEERRRKWRRSAFWRGFIVATVVGGVVALFAFSDVFAPRGPQIARVEVSGVIVDDPLRDDLLAQIAEAEDVRALVLRVNSPGGTTVGSESLFASIRAVAAQKPVVAVMGEVAASGGYIAAIAADYVIARGNSLTGSIGVIMEYPDLTALLERLGIGVETVRSSALKAEPSPFRETNPAARAVENDLVADSYVWFRDLVAERRGLAGPRLERAANGQVFTGRLALEAGLVDAIGGEPEAVDWLESRDAALVDLPISDWAVDEEGTIVGDMLGEMASTSGILREIWPFDGPKLYSLAP